MDLKARWKAFAQELGLQETGVFEHVLTIMDSPKRAYHNLSHVEACLSLYDEMVPKGVVGPDTHRIEMAIWFHDLIYSTLATDNEAQSAHYMRQLMSAAGYPEADVEAVEKMISLTKHQVVPVSMPMTQCFMLDIDLSILGSDPETFDQYEVAIRKEYEWVLEATFKAKRAEILTGFLKRQYIYNTAKFYFRFEDQARANLTKAVAKLRA